jgi:hypothetical protein
MFKNSKKSKFFVAKSQYAGKIFFRLLSKIGLVQFS